MKTFTTIHTSIITLLIAVLFLSGCSNGKSPVKGTVQFEDGSPLTRGVVFAQNDSGTLNFTGAIQPDGSFTLGTVDDGTGVPAGHYRVYIGGANLYDAEKGINEVWIHKKYESAATSDLELNVTGTTRLDLVVAKPE
jgi:hypothetical protein